MGTSGSGSVDSGTIIKKSAGFQDGGTEADNSKLEGGKELQHTKVPRPSRPPPQPGE